MVSKDFWAGLGSALASLLTLITIAMNHVRIRVWINKIALYFSPYIHITIHEYTAEHFERSDLFVAIEAYLSDRCARRARKLKAELGGDKRKPEISIDDRQEIVDTYQGGATLRWYADTVVTSSNIIILKPGDEARRYYRVSFHRKFHDSILNSYLPYVLEKGREVIAKNRHRRLFTNNPMRAHDGENRCWSHVAFQHPATFAKLAMDPVKKADIINDLTAFKEGKDYYSKVGKPWKRGYLLFGPPGTGKSTMIAAMANFLDYDIYDLELTTVKDNTELRRLFVEMTGKSIIVIEDIDRTVDITINRRGAKKKANKKSSSESDSMTSLRKEDNNDDEDTKLTLSGLLNFIDGLWSACGGERIIIFTTNNKDKLDPALIRRGRMDMAIEMSYCRYEAFKVLASNYLDITDHQLLSQLFGEIQKLLEEVDMSPADVAEHLMRKEKRDADACLKGLVVALKNAKELAAVKDKGKEREVVEIIHGENGGSRS